MRGSATIYAGGVTSDGIVSNGLPSFAPGEVISGGLAVDTIVASGGLLQLYGATTYALTASNPETSTTTLGSARGTVEDAGAALYVASGGVALDTTLQSPTPGTNPLFVATLSMWPCPRG